MVHLFIFLARYFEFRAVAKAATRPSPKSFKQVISLIFAVAMRMSWNHKKILLYKAQSSSKSRVCPRNEKEISRKAQFWRQSALRNELLTCATFPQSKSLLRPESVGFKFSSMLEFQAHVWKEILLLFLHYKFDGSFGFEEEEEWTTLDNIFWFLRLL